MAFSERHELGWDPTMTVVGPGQYDIVVHNLVNGYLEPVIYRTLGMLADGSAEETIDSGTRVFLAKLVIDGKLVGALQVLKDCWVVLGRDSEGNLNQKIATQCIGSYGQHAVQRALRKVSHHGYVVIEEAGKYDTTVHLMSGGNPVKPTSPILDIRPPLPARSRKKASSGEGDNNQEANSRIPPEIVDREELIHYRVVFDEVCKPLEEVTDLPQIMQYLHKAATGAYVQLCKTRFDG